MFRNCSMLSFRCWHFNYRNNNKNSKITPKRPTLSCKTLDFWSISFFLANLNSWSILERITFLLLNKSWGDDVGWHRSPFTEKTIGHDMNRWRSFKIEICVRVFQIFFKIWCSNLMLTKKSEGFIFCWSFGLFTGFFLVKIHKSRSFRLRLKHENPFVEWILEYLPFTRSSGLLCMFFSVGIPYQTGKNPDDFGDRFLVGNWQSILVTL